ncbi:hypothetical protein CSAL01_07725 [Colletotrichum salicis]|uniref:DRBM domain-containing protein n=1 Tax=Colletotrichum salicis TaxID=1209931 RepID=A0A135V9I2_9PEZI|nr:hypothetical protein CSAL01_07725 [Colletotrichum salicis]
MSAENEIRLRGLESFFGLQSVGRELTFRQEALRKTIRSTGFSRSSHLDLEHLSTSQGDSVHECHQIFTARLNADYALIESQCTLSQHVPRLLLNEARPSSSLEQLKAKVMELHGSAASISGSCEAQYQDIGRRLAEATARQGALPPFLNDDHFGLKQLCWWAESLETYMNQPLKQETLGLKVKIGYEVLDKVVTALEEEGSGNGNLAQLLYVADDLDNWEQDDLSSVCKLGLLECRLHVAGQLCDYDKDLLRKLSKSDLVDLYLGFLLIPANWQYGRLVHGREMASIRLEEVHRRDSVGETASGVAHPPAPRTDRDEGGTPTGSLAMSRASARLPGPRACKHKHGYLTQPEGRVYGATIVCAESCNEKVPPHAQASVLSFKQPKRRRMEAVAAHRNNPSPVPWLTRPPVTSSLSQNRRNRSWWAQSSEQACGRIRVQPLDWGAAPGFHIRSSRGVAPQRIMDFTHAQGPGPGRGAGPASAPQARGRLATPRQDNPRTSFSPASHAPPFDAMSACSHSSQAGTWQERLEGACREAKFTPPLFQIVSERRGGRTAWSSRVTVHGRTLSARFWYDGKNLNNAREDAAEMALNYLTGSNSSQPNQRQ